MPCHSNMLSVLALYLQLCSCESQFYMLGGTLCEEWDEGRANSFLTWIFAQMSPDLLQVVSWLILASHDDDPNLRHDMKWGILMSGVFIFW